VQDDRVVWLNGELIPWSAATVPLLSHGFSRASAIFEAFGTHPGPDGVYAFRMDEHLKRLRRSAELLEMELGCTDDEIAAGVASAVKANGIGRGLIKIMAYWSEEAVVRLVLDSPLDVAIFAVPPGDDVHMDDATPISACLSSWRKLHPETAQVESKACANYLNAYLVRREATRRGYDVAFLLGTDGFLAEGTTESIFLVNDGVLRTPPLGRILRSISRLSLLEIAPTLGIPVQEVPLRPEALFAADEIFTAHTGVKVHPVGTFEDCSLEAPGPVTTRLLEQVEATLSFQCSVFKHFFQRLD
jgi:branched-chain amino acid aminotransferase